MPVMTPAATAVPGAIFLTAGLLFSVLGTLLWWDSWGLLTWYYDRCVRAHRRLPLIGEAWIRRTPLSMFRRQTLALLVGGVLFAAVGIYILVRS